MFKLLSLLFLKSWIIVVEVLLPVINFIMSRFWNIFWKQALVKRQLSSVWSSALYCAPFAGPSDGRRRCTVSYQRRQFMPWALKLFPTKSAHQVLGLLSSIFTFLILEIIYSHSNRCSLFVRMWGCIKTLGCKTIVYFNLGWHIHSFLWETHFFFLFSLL